MNLEMVVEELLLGQACFASDGYYLLKVGHSFCLEKSFLKGLEDFKVCRYMQLPGNLNMQKL
jgi:hypothetical protein